MEGCANCSREEADRAGHVILYTAKSDLNLTFSKKNCQSSPEIIGTLKLLCKRQVLTFLWLCVSGDH